jgi:DNA-binding phage protein
MLTLGHFGDHKRFEGLIELRWKNGTRVYSFMWGDAIVIALNGGIKMAKIVTSKEQKKSGTKSLKAHVPFKSRELKEVNLVIDTLLDCIKTGDIETFREVLMAHLMTVNKVKLAQKAGIGRRTLYDLIDPKKEFNPELSTISALIQALAA